MTDSENDAAEADYYASQRGWWVAKAVLLASLPIAGLLFVLHLKCAGVAVILIAYVAYMVLLARAFKRTRRAAQEVMKNRAQRSSQ